MTKKRRNKLIKKQIRKLDIKIKNGMIQNCFRQNGVLYAIEKLDCTNGYERWITTTTVSTVKEILNDDLAAYNNSPKYRVSTFIRTPLSNDGMTIKLAS